MPPHDDEPALPIRCAVNPRPNGDDFAARSANTLQSDDPRVIPGRLLVDTCVLNTLYDEGAFVFDGDSEGRSESEIDPDVAALRPIFLVNQRAHLQLVVSPLSVAEVANTQDYGDRERRLRWLLDVLDHWLITLDDIGDRAAVGGSVRHRFKLTPALQELEQALLGIPDFRRDPFDRLLLLQCRMGGCDAFLTSDRATIWRHRQELRDLGIRVLTPVEYWSILRPWASLWV